MSQNQSPESQSLPIALQIYTLRSLTQSPAEVLAEVAAAGYSGVELAGTFAPGMDPAELRKLLDDAGLRVVSNHISIAALEEDLPAVVRAQQTLGNSMIIVPWLAPDQRGQTAEAWKELGARLAGLARRCAHAGMDFMYHNHDFEMVMIDGRPAIDWLMQGAEEAGVPIGFEIDMAWAQYGGQDPVACSNSTAAASPACTARTWPSIPKPTPPNAAWPTSAPASWTGTPFSPPPRKQASSGMSSSTMSPVTRWRASAAAMNSWPGGWRSLGSNA